LLEQEVVPEFYDRDARGLPRVWLARVRASMSRLAPQFSATRMMCDYVEGAYLPAAGALRRRLEQGGELAAELCAWKAELEASWTQVRFGTLDVRQEGDRLQFAVQVYLGDLPPDWVRVELYAEPAQGESHATRVVMARSAQPDGMADAFDYRANVPASRPAADFTPRIIPFHADAIIPIEAGFILWQR
jgi:starch phosphorylase